MNELTNIELLEKYFNYELSDTEDVFFKTKLAKDATFKEEYEIALVLRAKALKKRRSVFEQDYKPNVDSTSKLISLKKYMPLLAAASLFIFIAISLFISKQNNSIDTLMAVYENPNNAEKIENIRSVNSASSQLLVEAITAFNEKQFMPAASKFKQYDLQTDLSNEQLYYYGQSLWYSKQYQPALIQFIKSNYGRDAQWYIALCHIKLKQHLKAKLIIETLLNEKYGTEKDQKNMEALLKKL